MRLRTKLAWVYFGYCVCVTVFCALCGYNLCIVGFLLAFFSWLLADYLTKKDELLLKGDI